MMISNFSNILLFTLFFSFSVAAQRVFLDDFCHAIHGNWQGKSARPNSQQPQPVVVHGLCSNDKKQLFLSISGENNMNASESWWFKQIGRDVLLTFYNGKDEKKSRKFSLYKNSLGFSFLGKGNVHERPALIQLRFDHKDQGWQWLQQVRFLDDDVGDYRFVRAIDMQSVQQ